jgi:hypothetical protein
MLLKEEFAANMGYLEPSINSMIVAGEGRYQQLAHVSLSLLSDFNFSFNFFNIL